MADDAQGRYEGNRLVPLLAVATAALAIAVALLVWVTWPPNGPGVDVDVNEIAAAVSKRLEKDGFLKKDAFDERMDGLEEAVSLRLTTNHFNQAIADLKRAIEAINGACCDGSTAIPPVAHQPRIWVAFDNARLDEDPTGTLAPIQRLTKDSDGIALPNQQRQRLNRLAAALRACALPDRRVRLRIQGYSSTREFVDAQGQSIQGSQALNVKAANLRAGVVIDNLHEQRAGEDDGVDIDHVPWTDYSTMRRPFLDSREEFQSAAQELLNRVVLVEVRDAGGCALENAR